MAATETFNSGAYIIDMGQPTQTVANGLKPYGLVYELVVKRAIPVKWAIASGKVKDGIDFTANSKGYKGGSFIIPAEYAADALTTINAWKSQGVMVDGPIASSFSAPIYDTINSFPNSVLDLQNGAIAAVYFTNAGIPQTTTGAYGSFNTYRSDYPSGLNPCDDIFIMPHADPTWTTHKNLIPFNQSKGFIWAGCHAVSVLELVDDPGDADTLPNMNFLSTNTALIKYRSHAEGVAPYVYDALTASDPIMQFIGKLDLATNNGSEQIYLPKIGSAWLPSTTVAVYDDPHTNVPSLSPGRAAKVAYGFGFGNPSNGMVMYEGGHNLNATTLTPDNIAAQRAFLNFVLLAGIARRVNITTNIPAQIPIGQTVNVSATATGGSGLFSYQWYSSCGGNFANATAANTTFTAPSTGGACNLRVVVKDSCNHRAFGAQSAIIAAPSADLSITKTDGQNSIMAGSQITYTITVTNNGPNTVNSVTVTDNVPATILNPTFTPSNGTYNNSTGIWSGLNLATGQSASMTLKGTISISATGNLTNTATVAPPAGFSDPNSVNNSSTDTDTITAPQADLSIFKTNNQTTVTRGSLTTYTITVTNNGPSTVNSLTFTDTASPALGTPITITPSTGTINTTTGVWSGLNLAAGQTVTLTLSAIATTGAPVFPNQTNTATISPPSGITDPNTANNSSTDTDTRVAGTQTVDLSITKSDGQTTAIPGSPITYTITVRNVSSTATLTSLTMTDALPATILNNNNGPSPVTSVKVTDAVPATILSPSFTASSGTYNNNTGDWTGLNLANGENAVLTLSGTVSASATGNLTNTATVAPPTGVTDTNSANNTSTDTDTLTPRADLSITKTDNQTIVNKGSPITYTITVTNNGPSTINSVKVTDAVPAAIVSPTFTPNTGSYNSSTGDWTGLSLAAGQSATLNLSGTVSASASGTIKNTATVAPLAGVTDPNPANDSSTDTDAVAGTSENIDLSIEKTDNQTSAIPGKPITYTITVTNNGPGTVESVNVTDAIPADIQDPIFSAPDGSYNSATGEWTELNLAPGSSATLIFDGTVSASASKELKNTATVSPPVGFTDTNSANDSSTDTTTLPVSNRPQLLLVKRITAINNTAKTGFHDVDTGSQAGDDDNILWPDRNTYLPGEHNGGLVKPKDEVEYTVYFLNTESAASNVTICDLVPDKMSFISTGYNNAVPRPTQSGALPSDTGIALALNATTLPTNPTAYLTNVGDGDRGRYYPPDDPNTPSTCKVLDNAGNAIASGAAANTNGAVVVDVVKGTGAANQLPPATAAGDPANSYGFIRFRAKVD